VLVLLPPWLRGRQEGRPGASISSFNRHLSTLRRTGGMAVRSAPNRSSSLAPVRRSPMLSPYGRVPYRSEAQRAEFRRQRQREVQVTLGAAVVLLAGLGLGAGIRLFTFLAGAGALAFAAYQGLILRLEQQAALDARVRRFPVTSPASPRPRVAEGGHASYLSRER